MDKCVWTYFATPSYCQGKKMQLEECAYGYFYQLRKNSSSLSFLSILGRKFFGGSGKKTLGSHHLLSFLLTQPNTLKKVFLPIFSPKCFVLSISPPNKHSIIDVWFVCFHQPDLNFRNSSLKKRKSHYCK